MSVEHARGESHHFARRAVRAQERRPQARRERVGVLSRLSRLRPGQVALACAAVGIVLTASSLRVGFAQDDYAILSVFKGSPGLEPLNQPFWNAFAFSEGDAELNRYRMETGIVPWWTAEGWKVNLWRPLASTSHWVDYLLFGESPIPMHIHNLLLYAALCAAAVFLYYRTIPVGWVAAAAGLLFAVDAAHGIPAGWIANRNAVQCGLFAVLAMLAHHKWRTEAGAEKPWSGWHGYGLLSALCLTLALLSAEAAIGLGAYYFAYAVTLDPIHAARETPAPWRRRLNWRGHAKAIGFLLPYLAVVIVWRAVYSGLGYGASESWLYVDPLNAPLVFAKYLFIHTPLLIATLLGLLDTQLWVPMPPAVKVAYCAAIYAVVAGLAMLLRPVWKRDAVLRFWVIGAVLSVLPVAGATLPADRNLMLPSIGSAAVIALFLSYAVKGIWRNTARRWLAYGFAGFFLLTNVLLSAPMLAFNAYSIRTLHAAFEKVNATAPADEAIEEQTVIALNTPLDLLGASLPLLRSGTDRPAPKNWWWLYAGDSAIDLTRVDDRTIRLRPENGFIERPWAQLFRRPEATPIGEGHAVELSRMTAVVLEATDDGRPLHVEFQFDAPLDDPSFAWLAWDGAGYAPYDLPQAGETAKLRGVGPADFWRLATAFLEEGGAQSVDTSTD